MHPIPDYLSTQQESCRRLTRVLRPLPGPLLACWNRRSQRFEVWTPSNEYGWACVAVVETPDGRPCSPDVYPLYVLADLRSRLNRKDVGGMVAAHAEAVNKRWNEEMDEAGEAARYVAKAVAAEIGGTLRGGGQDVAMSLRSAMEGGTARRNAEERGQRIYIGGRG